MSFLSSPSWSENVSIDYLVMRKGLYYKTFTDTPFTGEVLGSTSGKIKNGVKDGKWLIYWGNGQLYLKKHYKDGKINGLFEVYYYGGQLKEKRTYKDGIKDGPYEWLFGSIR